MVAVCGRHAVMLISSSKKVGNDEANVRVRDVLLMYWLYGASIYVALGQSTSS